MAASRLIVDRRSATLSGHWTYSEADDQRTKVAGVSGGNTFRMHGDPHLSAGTALLLRRPFHEHPTMPLKILNSVPLAWRAVLHLAEDAGAVRFGAR